MLRVSAREILQNSMFMETWGVSVFSYFMIHILVLMGGTQIQNFFNQFCVVPKLLPFKKCIKCRPGICRPEFETQISQKVLFVFS